MHYSLQCLLMKNLLRFYHNLSILSNVSQTAFGIDLRWKLIETSNIVSPFCLQALEESIQEMEPSHQVGPLLLVTEKLRLSLIAEANSWKNMYGRYLNERCAKKMDDTLDFFNDMEKRLSRPVKDLDDIRSHMSALREIREKEIEIDMTIVPIEEAYILLSKYNLAFNDGNPERVDSLSYGWSKLTYRVSLYLKNNNFKM